MNERELDYGPLMPPAEFTVRFLRSRHEDAVALAHPERLERRMRAIARLGGLLGPGIVAWAQGREAAYAARLNQPLADHDVLLTPVTPAPPPRIGACEGRGWVWTTLLAGATVPYAACWNVTGQPACSVPAGFAADGLPRAVQLVGRPNDEATLLLAGRPARGRASVGAEPPARLLVTAAPEREEELLEVACDAARMAGALLVERAGRGIERDIASKSTPTDLVSEADLASERAIRELLGERRPDDGFLGEEGGPAQGTSGLSWVVDPLDGTINFLFGIPQWCVSVAVRDDAGRLPVRCTTRTATSCSAPRGTAPACYRTRRASSSSGPRGAASAPRRGSLSRRPAGTGRLAAAMVATGLGYDANVRRAQARVLERLVPRVRDIRRFGSAALDLTWTAAGRYDAYFERSVKQWDIAAGALICERAGLEVLELAVLENLRGESSWRRRPRAAAARSGRRGP